MKFKLLVLVVLHICYNTSLHCDNTAAAVLISCPVMSTAHLTECRTRFGPWGVRGASVRNQQGLAMLKSVTEVCDTKCALKCAQMGAKQT